ncbi:MAG: O-antigen ligase family protein [Bacteroidaceae bacterium]|nr:O-antigen ligase family protein [Bacteroidaceae bacterium]
MSNFRNWKELAKSGGLCGILLLIRPLIYLIFSRQRDMNAYSAIDLSATIFIIYAFICFFVALNALSKETTYFSKKLIFSTPLIWFIVYTIYGAISIFWSVNLSLTAFRAFECMAMILLIVAIMKKLFTTCSTEKIINWVILYVLIEIFISIVRTLKWNTNFFVLLESSQMVSTTFFFMALYYPRKKWYHYLILLMSIFSNSTVAYIGMVIGLISILWKRTKYKAVVVMGVMIFCFSFMVIGPEKVLKQTVFYDKESISLEETSGRDHLMEVSIETIKENPMGLGFFAGEPYIFYSRGLNSINAHNSIFSAGIGLGYIGIVIMIMFLLRMFVTVFSKYIPNNNKASLVGCFIVGFVHCMGNPALGSRVYGAWLPITVLFSLICSFYVYGKYYKRQ